MRYDDCDFDIIGVSYVGSPRSNTAMYVSKKVERLLENLRGISHCLVFAQEGIVVDAELQCNNYFVFSDNPQREYARFVNKLYEEYNREQKKRKYTFHPDGYYVGENAIIGNNAYIEPQCIIGHDVVIGDDANILYGTVIKNSIIGNDFLANEYAVIGSFGFTMAYNEEQNKIRIPTLGRVIIGNHVEIGAHDNIARGSAGETIIEDNVKIDSLVYIGHDVHLKRNVQINAGVIVGGFTQIGESSFIGVNASVRNRIVLGENSIIGMGSTVTKNIDDNVTVVGNPAKVLITNDGETVRMPV